MTAATPFARRTLFALAGGLAGGSATAWAEVGDRQLGALEAQLGGRIGVAVVDTRTGARLLHRANERFALCSTFKWILAAALLERVDKHKLKLDDIIDYDQDDLLANAPVTTAHVSEGGLPLGTLCQAAVEVSDNTAANLLLSRIGGPHGLTRFIHHSGDDVTRLDRVELELNTNRRGDPRDTTTPAAMVATLQHILLGKTLTPASRDRLIGWMRNCKTGLNRLRAGLPSDWIVADKTGSGENGAANDVAIVWPPARPPILIAAYLSDSDAAPAALDAAHAAIARRVVSAFG